MPPAAVTISRPLTFAWARILALALLVAISARLFVLAREEANPALLLVVVGMFLSAFLPLLTGAIRSGFSRRYFVIDGAGFSAPSMGRAIPWTEIEGVACRNDRTRRALRLFPRAGSAASARARTVGGTKVLEFPFVFADQPEASLEEAYRACVGWLTATRLPSDPPTPVREFVDDGDVARKRLWLGATGVAMLTLAVVVGAVFHLHGR